MQSIATDLGRLKQLAIVASHSAYCPYSRFAVGAVIVSSSGEEFSGCNVENASYGLSMCAERTAVYQMVSHGLRRIELVAVYTPTPQPTTPCGACRQVLFEFGPDARVVCFCDGDAAIDTTVRQLLPEAFGPDNLNGDAGHAN